MSERVDDCTRCVTLRDEVAFWKDQQKFAASVAADVADLDEVAPALRQMLRKEIERRQAAETEADRLRYELQQLRPGLYERTDTPT